MNTEEMSLKLGVNVSANILRPEPGDLLVLKVDVLLSEKQRGLLKEKVLCHFEELGCKAVVLEGGMDVLMIKKASETGGARG
jgi:hypothetical protein